MEPVVQVCTADKQVSQNLAPSCLNECPLSKPLTAMLCPLRSISNLKPLFLWNFFQPSFLLQFSSVAQSCPALCNPWIAARQASQSIINCWSLLKHMSIKLVMPSSHLTSPSPPDPQSLPASGSFPMSQLFAWGGQSIGVSALASVLPVNTQDWSALGWTGWISLQSKGLSRVFSNTTVQKHQFFGALLSSQSNSHIHTWPLEKP